MHHVNVGMIRGGERVKAESVGSWKYEKRIISTEDVAGFIMIYFEPWQADIGFKKYDGQCEQIRKILAKFIKEGSLDITKDSINDQTDKIVKLIKGDIYKHEKFIRGKTFEILSKYMKN